MKTINVDDDVYAELLRHAVGFNDTENDAIRRLLKLTAATPPQALSQNPSSQSGLSAFVASPEFQQYNQGIDRFLILLSWAHNSNPKGFAESAKANATRGTRRHFGDTKEEVESSGQHVVAKLIPGSSIWTLTSPLDNSTKRKVLGAVFLVMGFSPADVALIRAQIPDTDIVRRRTYDLSILDLSKA